MGMYRIPKRAEIVRGVSADIPEGPKAGVRMSLRVWRIPSGYADGGKHILSVETYDHDRDYRRSWSYSGANVEDVWHDYAKNKDDMRGWPNYRELKG